MAGLNDLDANTPAGNTTPTQGDDHIRQIKAKVKEFAAVEHSYDGSHKFPIYTSLPANDPNSRRIVIKDNSGVGTANELYYDSGTAWVKITSNQGLIDYLNDLAAHSQAATIDHPNSSVTRDKVASGAIVKKHLAGGTDQSSLADLVNGSANGNGFHTHGGLGVLSVLETQTFTAYGSYPIPALAKFIVAEVWSAGGNGNGWNNAHGAGAGGAYAKAIILNLGITSVIANVGGNGVASSVTGYISCTAGGNASVDTSGTGGVPSNLGNSLTLTYFGANGGNGGASVYRSGGGGGGCAGANGANGDGTNFQSVPGGAGGYGGGSGGASGAYSSGQAGQPGVFPGGGGGGGDDDGGSAGAGGLGAGAQIKITAWG